MHHAAALTAWLDDAEAQSVTAARTRAFRKRSEPGPLAGFRGAVESAGDDPELVLAAVRALFADPGWAEEIVAGLVEEAAADPFFLPPFRQLHHHAHDGLLLFDGETVSVGLIALSLDSLAARKVAAGGAGTIGFSGSLALYRVLRGEARLSLWRAPRIDETFDAGERPHCWPAGGRVVRAGEWLPVDGREEGFIVEAMTEPLTMLQAMIVPGRAPLAVDYDARTHAFVAATATDPAASHRQMTASLLRMLGREEAGPLLARETEEGAFFVRWHAMREWLALDAGAALPRLRAMAADEPHRDVRAAAARTLARLEARTCRA